MAVWVRLTRQAGLLEVREDYMRAAEQASKDVHGLADALALIMPFFADARVRIEAWGSGWGVQRGFCIYTRTGNLEDAVKSVEALGRVAEWVLRNRSLTWFQMDGYTKTSTVRVSSARIVLESRVYPGLTATLYIASNWLIGGKYKRYGRDNAIYIEYEDEKVLEWIRDTILEANLASFCCERRMPVRLSLEWLKSCEHDLDLDVEVPGNADSSVLAYVDFSEWGWWREPRRIVMAVAGFGEPYPGFLYPAGTRFYAKCVKRSGDVSTKSREKVIWRRLYAEIERVENVEATCG